MTPWRPFVVALALPILFTALVLIEVQRNRTGAREAIALSEREVTLAADTDENSGVTAWVAWSGDSEGGKPWLSEDTLRSLGFDLTSQAPDSPRGRASRQLQRRAYIVLELRNDPPTGSRLLPVDASTNRESLAATYPNGRTHMIAAGFVGLRRVSRPDGTSSLEGYLVNIDPRGIQVPTELAQRLRHGAVRNPTFTLLVRYGSNGEPWIVEVR